MAGSAATEANPALASSTVGLLPPPQPVLVANRDQVEVLIRSARATTAKLALQLRAVSVEVSKAEQGVGSIDSADTFEGEAATALLRSTLEERKALRRAELAAQVDRVREEGASRLRDARTEAAAIVAAARQDMLRALVDVAEAVPPAPPVLRVVTDHEHHGVSTAAPVAPPVPSPPPPAGWTHPSMVATASPPLAPAPLPPVAPVSPQPVATRSFLLTFLHVDVVLPLLAGLIVIVVLLAWMG